MSAALALSSLPAHAAADKDQAYWSAVADFVHGDSTKAIAALRALKPADISSAIAKTQGLGKAASRCRECPARVQFDALLLRAAILLHAGIDRLDRAAVLEDSNRAPSCSAGVHTTAAAQLAALLATERANHEFVVRMTVAMSLEQRALLCPLLAQEWADLGLKADAKDVLLHAARGMALEALGNVGDDVPLDRTLATMRGIIAADQRERDKKARLALAIKSFENALGLQPDFAEAMLHLGRAHWKLGHLSQARASLEQAAASNQGANLYLSHLYLGQVLDDQGDLEGAIKEYRRAATLLPLGQVAAIALSQALAIRGALDEANEALEVVRSQAGRRTSFDPHWDYLYGRTGFPEALFENMRKELLK